MTLQKIENQRIEVTQKDPFLALFQKLRGLV